MKTFPPMDGQAKSDRFLAWFDVYGPIHARCLANELQEEYRIALAEEAAAAKREKRPPRSLIVATQTVPMPPKASPRRRRPASIAALEKGMARLERSMGSVSPIPAAPPEPTQAHKDAVHAFLALTPESRRR